MKNKNVIAFIVFTLVFFLLTLIVLPIYAQDKSEESKQRVIVMFDQEVNIKAQEALLKAFGGENLKSLPIINGFFLLLPPSAKGPLASSNGVLSVENDEIAQITEDELPWGVDRIDAEIVWGGTAGALNVTTGAAGAGVDIAVIDTGIYYNHVDLDDNYRGGYDFVNSDTDPVDDNGHGTHVAGIIAAEDNGVGVIGVAPKANLYALKVLDSSGSGYYSNIILALDWSVNNNIEIVNMSFGGSVSSRSLQKACDNAYSSGVLLVAAAGNAGSAKILYPANYSSVIAVSATNQNDSLASFSNYGENIELSAPGVSIKSTFINDGYVTYSGTSMATPHVSGVAALVIAQGIAIGSASVRERLDNTAEDIGPAGKDIYFGFGIVDAEAATRTSTPPPQPIVESKMHIGSIEMFLIDRISGKNTFTKATATVTVVDENGLRRWRGSLSGTWSGATSDIDTGLTDSSGKVTLESNQIKKTLSGTVFTFTVNNISKDSWIYDSTKNIESSDSIAVP
ncbi:MAG: S8 family peptidase [Actinobacteria bacterium]|nr:S8 family peptidase [Actinomycetota bacterium]